MKVRTEQNVPDKLSFGPALTRQQAEQIYEQGKETVIFALLQQSQMLAQRNNLPAAIVADLSTPSAQKPVFTKDNKASRRCGKKPGRKKGHKGSRRQRPKIDRTVEHVIGRDFCPACDKIVEPVITEALPKSSID